ncbi:hypothetical protein BASA81_008054 [Batrachochytrium salamandrivorans]|nr:hypothetical protein BASA81_008054 [Batrachochytrium salamandrivorans]
MLSAVLRKRSMSVLVLAEHQNGKLNQATIALLSAAKQTNQGPVKVLVTGTGSESVSEEVAKLAGVDAVLLAADAKYDHGLAETNAALIAGLHAKEQFTHILALASNEGKNILPRVAAKLDVQPMSDVVKVVDANTFVRPVYAGNALATVKSSDKVKLLTIRQTAFDKKPTPAAASAKIETVSDATPTAKVEWKQDVVAKSDRPELASAKRVVSAGRGIKSADNFKIIYDLADKLGAGVGASRAAVDAGYCANDLQVGQTGKVVAPELYVAVGISGAVQHLAGMKDSKVIVAINKDPEAPIFQIADYGLEADLFTAVPELTNKL